MGLQTKGDIKVIIRPVAYPKLSPAEKSRATRADRPITPPLPPIDRPRASTASGAPARELIVDVRVVGNEAIELRKILGFLHTRKDRYFDPEVVQADKRRLNGTGMFRDVRVYTQRVPGGAAVSNPRTGGRLQNSGRQPTTDTDDQT